MQQPSNTLNRIRSARPRSTPLHAPVYRALWDRGFFITCVNGFAATTLHPGDPMATTRTCWCTWHGRAADAFRRGRLAARLANSVKKTAVLAEVGDGYEVRFSPIEQPTIRLFPFPSPEDVSRGGRGKVALDDEARANAVPIAESSGALAEAKALVAPVEGSGVQSLLHAPSAARRRRRLRRSPAMRHDRPPLRIRELRVSSCVSHFFSVCKWLVNSQRKTIHPNIRGWRGNGGRQ